MVLFLLTTFGNNCTNLESLHIKTHLNLYRPEREHHCFQNCFSNLKKLTVQKLCDAEIFFGVFNKNMSLIIEELPLEDLQSVAFVTICEGLKKLKKVEFKVDLTPDLCEVFDKKELAEIFDKNLQGTEVVVSSKHKSAKPLTFGQKYP